MKNKPTLLTAILSAALALQASADVQLLPAGEFAGRDGRPGKGKSWRLTDAPGLALAALLNTRHAVGRAEFSFDYQHQALLSEKNGQPAPASGWATQFEWRSGLGLFAVNVRWTERAKLMIEAGEYKYISPVILFDEASGDVQDVINAALTNIPNLMQMSAVAQAVVQLNASFSAPNPNLELENDMALLALLAAALALPATTTEAEAVAAVTALKTRADAPPKAVLPAALSVALGLAVDADETATLSAVTALKTRATDSGIDSASLQVVKDLQLQVASLSGQMLASRVIETVDAALTAGKLLPAQKDWAIKLGQTSLEQLSAFIKDAPVIAAGLGTLQTGGKEGTGTLVAGLTAEELKVATAMGIKPEAFKAAAVA